MVGRLRMVRPSTIFLTKANFIFPDIQYLLKYIQSLINILKMPLLYFLAIIARDEGLRLLPITCAALMPVLLSEKNWPLTDGAVRLF
jgi:hypothetical protein